MKSQVSSRTIREFINEVSDQHYAMSGVVIAVSAAQAAALGEACMQISFDNQVDTLDWQDITARIEKLLHLKNQLLKWADQEAEEFAQYHALADDNGAGLHIPPMMYKSASEIARLSIAARQLLQEFHSLALPETRTGLEIAIQLLKGTASAALRLLNSHLNQCPDAHISTEYSPLVAELNQHID